MNGSIDHIKYSLEGYIESVKFFEEGENLLGRKLPVITTESAVKDFREVMKKFSNCYRDEIPVIMESILKNPRLCPAFRYYLYDSFKDKFFFTDNSKRVPFMNIKDEKIIKIMDGVVDEINNPWLTLCYYTPSSVGAEVRKIPSKYKDEILSIRDLCFNYMKVICNSSAELNSSKGEEGVVEWDILYKSLDSLKRIDLASVYGYTNDSTMLGKTDLNKYPKIGVFYESERLLHGLRGNLGNNLGEKVKDEKLHKVLLRTPSYIKSLSLDTLLSLPKEEKDLICESPMAYLYYYNTTEEKLPEGEKMVMSCGLETIRGAYILLLKGHKY